MVEVGKGRLILGIVFLAIGLADIVFGLSLLSAIMSFLAQNSIQISSFSIDGLTVAAITDGVLVLFGAIFVVWSFF